MDRRSFITSAAIAAVSAKTIIISSAEAAGLRTFLLKPSEMLPLTAGLKQQVTTLLQWMSENGWAQLVQKVSGITLNTADPMDVSFFRSFHGNLNAVPGCDDFIGDQLITAGAPHRSLLYHLLACPRVRLEEGAQATNYPTLEQIDVLENYIYGLLPIDHQAINNGQYTLAVFSYEYRPACKTPHECYADLVFSRAAFSRVGTQDISAYDRVNRCFTNIPQDSAKEKEIAVTPARYGLFLAVLVPYAGIANNDPQKTDPATQYLLPVRKIFSEDLYLSNYQLHFSESHKNEKLLRIFQDRHLSTPRGVSFDTSKAPFLRESNSSTDTSRKFAPGLDTGMVNLTMAGSSVLLSSHPTPKLVWRAVQRINGKNERLRAWFPKYTKVASSDLYANRRYTSYKTPDLKEQAIDAVDVVWDHVRYHGIVKTDYHAPRNEAMFVNIREQVTEQNGDNITLLASDDADLWGKVSEDHWAGLFEDNICDGCVMADLTAADVQVSIDQATSAVQHRLLQLPRLPAVSIVTAPDFFPIIESYDLNEFRDLFLAGGVQDTSGARLKGNPNINLPGSARQAFPWNGLPLESETQNTVFAIITKHTDLKQPDEKKRVAEANSQTRTNFLPDSATLIFFPGWDMTYSSQPHRGQRVPELFYATIGLGSPFVEDSKLCAAANGMWAAASPDASRTFRGSLSAVPGSGVHPPTAVPLTDEELGYADESPAFKDHGHPPTTGWDGEQGPFIIKNGNTILVNFTDIRRSDYVQNALAGSFDMSLMRKISVAEIRYRMSCFQRCLSALNISNKDVWMVGAEKVSDWSAGAPGLCIPKNLYGSNNKWATTFRERDLSDGYLYLFTQNADPASNVFTSLSGSKRATQTCIRIIICQVSRNALHHCQLEESNNWLPVWS
jgi:hypothetical protein